MRRSWMIGLCALLAPLAPSMAADAYVPLAAHTTLGAATYRTLLIATNTGSTSAGFSVAFFASNASGAPTPSSYSLPPGATLRLYNAVPAGARGMFEIDGSPAIVVSARIEALAGNGNVLASSQVPVITAANAVAAGERASLIGLEHSAAGATSDFGLLNLSNQPAQCTVNAFRAKGGRIGETIRLTLQPRSNRDFAGALAILGQTSIKDVRFDVSCDRVFGTYALVYRSGGPETVVLGPAASLEQDLTPAGGGGAVDGGVTFSLPGQFAVGNRFASFDLPLQAGVQYGHARMEFDLFIERWLPTHPLNPNFKNVASFRRSAKSRPERLLYWGLILKGSDDFRTILDMGMAPGEDDGLTIKSGKGPWKPRSSYHLVFDFDAEARRIVFEVYQGGQRLQRLEGPVVFTDIFNLPDKTVRVDFSSDGVGDGAYFPTTGWKYSNLVVKLTPRGQSRN